MPRRPSAAAFQPARLVGTAALVRRAGSLLRLRGGLRGRLRLGLRGWLGGWLGLRLLRRQRRLEAIPEVEPRILYFEVGRLLG